MEEKHDHTVSLYITSLCLNSTIMPISFHFAEKSNSVNKLLLLCCFVRLYSKVLTSSDTANHRLRWYNCYC